MLDLRQLLRVRSAYAGRFDPDGRRLLFVSDLGIVPQVWAVGADGQGWPELVVAPPDRAQTLFVGPQPGQVAVGADVGGNEHTQILYAGAPLHDDPAHIYQFGSFSPDGQRISFASNTRSTRWFDLYVHELASGEERRVLEHDSSNRAGPFSPDGRWLVGVRSYSNAHQELWLVDLRGGDPPRLLTNPDKQAQYSVPEWSPDGSALYCCTDLDRDLSAPARLDVGSGRLDYLVDLDVEVDECALDPTGRRLAYAVNRDGAAEIVVRELASGAEQRVEGLPPGALYTYWQRGLAWDRGGQRLAISWTASRASPNVWVYACGGSQGPQDASPGEQPRVGQAGPGLRQVHAAGQAPATITEGTTSLRQVTHAEGGWLETARLVEPEHVVFPSFDGRQIPGLYYPGHGTDTGPCVVVVHGGPEGQFRPTFQPLVQHLASAGMAVLAPNVRGSSGYGKQYLHLDDVRLRMDSVADLAHAVAWLKETGRADPNRIAVYGGSYGGFMVLAALTTYPDLWAAGDDLVGIANFVTFLENTGPWRRHLREAEYGSLEHDREYLESISPINHVDRIRAPLFVIHGANDPRVPIGEAEQMVQRLQALGRTVEFVRLEDEGHQISKLKNRLAVYPMVSDFLRQHLQV